VWFDWVEKKTDNNRNFRSPRFLSELEDIEIESLKTTKKTSHSSPV
jgi:hypothetical protein